MRPLLWALLPFCAAITLSTYGLTGTLPFLLATLAVPAAALSLVFHGRTRVKLLLVAISWGVGFLWCMGYQQLVCAPAQRFLGEGKTFTATVTAYPKETDYGHSIEVEVHPKDDRAFRALLYLTEGGDGLEPGDQLTGTGNFTDASVRREHTTHTYTAQGIFALGKKVALSKVRHTGRDNPRWWLTRASHWLVEQLDGLYSGEAAGILRALTAGDQSGLSDRFRSDLSRTGLSHITAVSGMHLVFFVEFVLLLPGGRRWKSILALPLLVLFALFTGASPSVVRAAVMEGILLLGNVLLREYDSWTALTVALFVLLAQNPFAIGSIGLQLSFASVVGIRLFMPKRQEREEVPPKWKRWLWRLWQSVALTLSATVFTLPLSVYYFDNISLIAPLANLAVLWCIPLLMGGGFVTGLLSGVALPLAKLLALPVSLLANGLTAAIHWFSLRPFAALDGTSPWMRLWLLFTYLLLLLYYLGKPKGWKVAGLFGVSIAALVALVLGYRSTMNDCAMTTQVLDVGQGQCVLFVSQDHAAVVDCGGSGMNSAGDKLGNQLELLGIHELDALILTHYDSDHINGLEALLERTHVTQVIAPTPEEGNQDAVTVQTLCAQHDIPWNRLKQDETLSLGAGRLQIYAPLAEGKSNESGLAVVSTVHDFDVLVTGDMAKATEKKLLQAKGLPDIEVLVAGHHGSSYSTGKELLDATTPEAAVISVGEENSYGHPGQETLDRLEERNIAVYRTDLEGTITIQED